MTPTQDDIITLAKEIYVDRLDHLTPSHWDFRPVATLAINAAQEFFKAAAEVLAQPPEAPATQDPPSQGQSQAGPI
jgi:hypothetical protein